MCCARFIVSQTEQKDNAVHVSGDKRRIFKEADDHRGRGQSPPNYLKPPLLVNGGDPGLGLASDESS
jgi:hypothetical protein